MPPPGEHVMGGHCVTVTGYDNGSRRFIIRNSWGTSRGRHGYGTMPYEYLLSPHYSSDLRTVRTVTAKATTPLHA